MKLTLDRGLKSYDIEDADGTPLGTIYVNPADLGIAARLDEARKAVQALADGLGDDVDAEKISDVDRQIKEQVNYGIMQIVEDLGLSFAFPTQTLYVHPDK